MNHRPEMSVDTHIKMKQCLLASLTGNNFEIINMQMKMEKF